MSINRANISAKSFCASPFQNGPKASLIYSEPSESDGGNRRLYLDSSQKAYPNGTIVRFPCASATRDLSEAKAIECVDGVWHSSLEECGE